MENYKNYSLGSLVDIPWKVPVSFLPCSVPNLHFEPETIKLQFLGFKINANGGNMGHLIFSIGVTKQ